MSIKETPKLFRILAQTESMTITAETSRNMTSKEAEAAAREDVILPTGKYNPFVIIPICTEFQWKYGQINFCPRCGKNICEHVGSDYHEGVTESLLFECPECEAEVFVNISNTPEQHDDDYEEEDNE